MKKALGKFCTVLENGQQKTTVRVHRGLDDYFLLEILQSSG